MTSKGWCYLSPTARKSIGIRHHDYIYFDQGALVKGSYAGAVRVYTHGAYQNAGIRFSMPGLANSINWEKMKKTKTGYSARIPLVVRNEKLYLCFDQ